MEIDLKYCSDGEATIEPAMKINGIPHICVGILGTNKVIAICGVSGATDEKESLANAYLIASNWNKTQRES